MDENKTGHQNRKENEDESRTKAENLKRLEGYSTFISFPSGPKVNQDDDSPPRLSLSLHLKNKLPKTDSESHSCVNISLHPKNLVNPQQNLHPKPTSYKGAARDPPEARDETPVFPRRVNPHIPQNSFRVLPSYKGAYADPQP